MSRIHTQFTEKFPYKLSELRQIEDHYILLLLLQ
jgi:hypothetical protein